ncbi:MAG: thioredoxin-dependent thiol peroxidase [Mangrovibacterium sp.]
MAQLETGVKAPNFTGVNQHGKQISLAHFAGKKTILYFYPRNNTPGCTAEACNLSDNHDFWIKQGYQIIGVSPDTVESHQKFIAKYELPFDLISDSNHEILEAYGAWGEKNNYGKVSMGVIRTTYVIDEKGIITAVFKRPKTKEHTEEIKKKLEIE